MREGEEEEEEGRGRKNKKKGYLAPAATHWSSELTDTQVTGAVKRNNIPSAADYTHIKLYHQQHIKLSLSQSHTLTLVSGSHTHTGLSLTH